MHMVQGGTVSARASLMRETSTEAKEQSEVETLLADASWLGSIVSCSLLALAVPCQLCPLGSLAVPCWLLSQEGTAAPRTSDSESTRTLPPRVFVCVCVCVCVCVRERERERERKRGGPCPRGPPWCAKPPPHSAPSPLPHSAKRVNLY